MKFLKIIKVSTFATVVAFTLNLTATTFAISSTASDKVRDFKLKPTKGKVLRTSDVSIAIRKIYGGARPNISKRESSMRANCYDVKFVYKDELKRVSFNCSSTSRVLTMLTK